VDWSPAPRFARIGGHGAGGDAPRRLPCHRSRDGGQGDYLSSILHARDRVVIDAIGWRSRSDWARAFAVAGARKRLWRRPYGSRGTFKQHAFLGAMVSFRLPQRVFSSASSLCFLSKYLLP